MKYLIISIGFIFFFGISGCTSDEEKNVNEKASIQDSIRVADSISQVRSINSKQNTQQKVEDFSDYFVPESPEFQNKVKEGKIIVLSDSSNSTSFTIEGSKAMAISMPDGNLYQAKKVGDKTIVTLPNGKEMERQEKNGKIYLVSDNNTEYEVVMAGDKMLAVTPDDLQITLSRK